MAGKFVEQCSGQVMMSFTYTTIITGGIATDAITWRSKWKQIWCALKLIISPLIDIYMLPPTMDETMLQQLYWYIAIFSTPIQCNTTCYYS